MNSRPSELELAEILEVVRSFIPSHRQPRWQAVLTRSPEKWARLDMDDLFRIADTNTVVRRVQIERELEADDLAANPGATLFRFSASPYVVRGLLRELVDDVVEDDAIISVNHGTVALASHHSDGWVVCRKVRSGA